jgi:hypothetical protein
MNTNTTTTTTFEAAVDTLGEEMMALYNRDEQGLPVIFDEEQEQVAKTTVDEVRKASIKAFTPLVLQLQEKLAEQEEVIEALQAELATLAVATPGPSPLKPLKDGKARLLEVKCPTLAELIELHKGNGKNIKGYNVYCMVYKNVHDCFPGEGVWKTGMSDAEKKPWNDVAKAYTAYRQASAAPIAAAAAPSAIPMPSFAQNMTPQMLQALLLMAQAQVPVQAQAVATPAVPGEKASKATSAYRLWLNDWIHLPENKGKSFAPAGTWKDVPAAVKAQYEAKFKALQAPRA